MSDESAVRVHWSFWIIGAVALIWNAMGAMNYLWQVSADSLAGFPESHRAIIETRPAWATGAFAIAVFGGALGCLLLLLRKSSAYYLFIASLLGVTATMIHSVGVVVSTGGFNLFEIVMMILMPLVVAAFLIWYSKHALRKGWVS